MTKDGTVDFPEYVAPYSGPEYAAVDDVIGTGGVGVGGGYGGFSSSPPPSSFGSGGAGGGFRSPQVQPTRIFTAPPSPTLSIR